VSAIVTASMRLAGIAGNLALIMLASFAMPVTCRCGDQVPGAHALVVAINRVDGLQAATTSTETSPRTEQDLLAHQQDEQPFLSDMPTIPDHGLAAINTPSETDVSPSFPLGAPDIGDKRPIRDRVESPTTPPPQMPRPV
jgi:hypothetical protein